MLSQHPMEVTQPSPRQRSPPGPNSKAGRVSASTKELLCGCFSDY